MAQRTSNESTTIKWIKEIYTRTHNIIYWIETLVGRVEYTQKKHFEVSFRIVVLVLESLKFHSALKGKKIGTRLEA